MKLKDIFNIENIYNYLEGHARLYYDKLQGLPKHEKEQIAYRLQLCKDDCVPKEKCIHCGCPTYKKVFNRSSCNNGERFPNIMGEEEWKKFKEENNIT